MINREDMLELTRRMTLERNCFCRIAGAYFDSEGFVDGTFNTHFGNLSKPEQKQKLGIAKAIPFAKTNEQLREYPMNASKNQGSMKQFLIGLLNAELKNDAMLDIFYEMFGEKYHSGREIGIFFYLGDYDIPLKGTDKIAQWESEEVYRFLICAVCPVDQNYEPGPPECGFLYPAFKNRSGHAKYINVFQGEKHPDFMKILEIT